MAPVITVYVNNPSTESQTKWIHNLSRLGYEPLIDAVHKNDYQWFVDNFKYEHCFYYSNNEDMFDFTISHLDHEMAIKPDISICFDNDTNVSHQEWNFLFDFVSHIFNEKVMTEDQMDKVYKLIPLPYKESKQFPNYQPPPQQDYYSISMYFAEEQDTMIYEVIKPFTDLPYTTITRQFSEKGHIPFFTSLFICQSWGVCKQDIVFLKQIWDDLQIPEEFNIDQLLKERTELCYPSSERTPEPEPVVYRRDLNHVLQILQSQLVGR